MNITDHHHDKFNRVGPGYELLSSELADSEKLELQARGENLDAIVLNLPLQHVRRALDVGCGSGVLGRALARYLGDESMIFGVDISPDHIRYARQIASEQGYRNLRFYTGDILDSTREWESDFDLVFCRYLMMTMLPKKQGQVCLAQMKQLACPGGKIACIEADINFGQLQFPMIEGRLSQVMAEVVRYYRDKGLIEWRCGIQLFQEMTRAGLSEVEVKLVDGRIIQGGRPRELIEHDSLDLEHLVRPCLEELGMIEEAGEIVQEWRNYLANPTSFLYTPIFLAIGTVA